jgi:hypothetical protein
MTKRLISLVFLAFSVLLTTGCAIPYANQQGGMRIGYRDAHTAIDIGGSGSTGGQQGGGYPQGGNMVRTPHCDNGKSPGVLHLPSDAKNGQVVCAYPGDPNVQFFGQQQFVRPTPSLNSNTCPSGFRQINGRWVCMDR